MPLLGRYHLHLLDAPSILITYPDTFIITHSASTVSHTPPGGERDSSVINTLRWRECLLIDSVRHMSCLHSRHMHTTPTLLLGHRQDSLSLNLKVWHHLAGQESERKKKSCSSVDTEVFSLYFFFNVYSTFACCLLFCFFGRNDDGGWQCSSVTCKREDGKPSLKTKWYLFYYFKWSVYAYRITLNSLSGNTSIIQTQTTPTTTHFPQELMNL